ncbi:MAG: PadR family transcriptional regulator [Candidatus Aegiribacteria sp.]|nr:PadR family transcriptional regulator [Candidatus Aegiribacteria sp.]
MSTRLVILGLLREPSLYGYEIKQIIEERMGDWTSIAFGSIYFALGKLAEEGFIEKVAAEQEGSRPSRSIYQITKAGRAEFLRLLRVVWSEVEIRHFAFDIGLFFTETLPVEEMKGYLRRRIAQLEATFQHVTIHRAEQLAQKDMPRSAAVIFDHSLAHFQAELDWTRDLLDKVERGEYP